MSNHNQNLNNGNGNNQVASAQLLNQMPVAKKPTIREKALHAKDKILANKFGRMAVRGLKALGICGIGVACYKAGVRSVKPTTVYIKEGVTEEDSTPTETTTNEESTENQEET